MTPDLSTNQRKPGALALGGCVVAAAVVGLLTLVIWSLGVLPEDSFSYVLAAVLVATLTCSLGVFLKLMALTRKVPVARSGQMIQLVVLGDFLIQVFVLGIIMVALHFSGVKFASNASFALAFAGVVFVFPLVATLILVKGLAKQARPDDGPAENGKQLSDLTSS
ncbi:MAG: hypothetical protein ACYTG5_05805 [Planctomycetota bacterium]|jgi:hypothetical protein